MKMIEVTSISSFQTKIEGALKLGRAKIAFGLAEHDEEILASLRESLQYADIRLVGPPQIDTPAVARHFTVDISNAPESRLAELLATDQVQGIVRGTIDDGKTTQAYEQLTREKYSSGPALLEDPQGRQFFMSPLSNKQGWTKEERLAEAKALAEFVKTWDIKPRIAVYTAVRKETFRTQERDPDLVSQILNQTFRETEWIVSNLRNNDYDAENCEIEIDRAVQDGFNIHIPLNGMVGNQILRVFLFCGGKIVAATRLGLSRLWEDNSRTEKDFRFHVRWLTAMINIRECASATPIRES